jgi:ATP-dependent RNA helicase DeaD
MAGTHSIHNASRMGKEKLIGVLHGVLAARATTAEPAPEATLVSNDGAAAALAPVAEAVPVKAEPAPAIEPEVISPESVATFTASANVAGSDEPEELDAASVSAFADVPAAAPAPAAVAEGDAAGEGAPGEGVPGEGVPGEGEPRRRRRRRRRGRGRNGERDGVANQSESEGADESDESDGDEAGDESAPAPAAAAPAVPVAATSEAPVADAPAVGEAAPVVRQPFGERLARRPESPAAAAATGAAGQPTAEARPAHGERRSGERGRDNGRDQGRRDQNGRENRDSSRDQAGREQGGREQAGREQGGRDPRQPQAERSAPVAGERSPRPRLDGIQRPVPSVLDRLSVFTRGILELCDPSTPSWAQPRLAELLAEAGVVPMPATGAPHSEYHRIVGTIATTALPAGQICEIIAQGFALRGDRGDLFCLRKADVRIAGVRNEDGAPRAPSAPAPVRVAQFAPEARAEVVVQQDAPAAPVFPEATVPEATVPGATVSEATVSEATVTAAVVEAPVVVEAVIAEVAVEASADGLPPSVYQERPRRERGRRDRGDRREASPEAAALAGEPEVLGAPAAEAEPVIAEVAVEAAPLRVPVPSPGRSPERTHPRESALTAQPLPLTHLATDELAAKPKAEGFRALGLNDQILADLAAMGWNEPSPIQASAIPVALSGKDLIGQAQTGTGKTAGFVLPTLQKLYALEGEGPVALMMCPTRELAKQVYNEFIKMAGSSAARAALIYGGVDMNEQYRALERKPHVVIGTPGRVIDHMKRKTLDLSNLATIVLDEADQMLDIGFWPDVTYIMSHTPPQRQVLLFSATFPEQVKELAEKHMKDPERIQIAPEQVTVSNIDQKYIAVPRERKNELLARFIETFNPPQLVVFCKTKHQTDRVAEVLKRKNMSAGAIHGDLPQSKREKTLQAFRSGELQSLVATNVAARGLDIPSVSHVVNYDVPETPEEYVHRIGRTARNGASGVARTFITSEDGQFLLEIEKHIGLLLEEEQVEGFTVAIPAPASTRTIADAPVGTPRLLKPLIGGIRLGRRR